MTTEGKILIELGIDDSGMPVVIRRAVDSLRGLQTTLNQTTLSVKKLEEHNASLATKFRHLVMTMGNLRFVAMDINDIFLRMPVAILKAAGELERTQMLMTGLSKETSKAAKEAEGLKNFNFVTGLSKKAPFDIAALSDSFVKLKTAGMDPANGSMVALVDSVARFGGTSETLKRASVAIQQMSGKGVISMEELRQQLGEAVPTAMKDMADGMGVSMQQLAKIVQTGTLAAGPALEKMFLQMRINNEGASAEMMKTWSGTMSRLKTEWELAEKFIADSGFGNAAKDAVKQLTVALQSTEFRAFAADAGASMGEAMKMAMAAIKTMAQFRGEIVTLGEAWIAYKVIFSLIPGLSKTLAGSYDAIASRMAQERKDLATAKSDRVSDIVQQSVQAATRKTQTAAALLGYQQELQAVRMKNAAVIAEEAKLQAILAASKGGIRLPGSPRFQPRSVAVDRIKELGAANAVLTARQGELTAATAVTTGVLNTQTVAAARAEAAMLGLAATTKMQTVAATAAAAAARGLSLVYAALGGPVGIGILAIMGLVYAWNKVSNAADEALDRQRRAAAGTTTAAEQAENAQALQMAKQKLRFAEGVSGAKMPQARSKEQFDRESALLKTAQEGVLAAQKTFDLGARAVLEESVRGRVSEIALGTKRLIDATTEASMLESSSIEKAKSEKLAAMKAAGLGESKEYQKVNNELIAQQRKILLKRLGDNKETAASAKLAAAAIANDPKTGAAERSAQLKIYEEQAAAEKQFQSELDATNKAIESKVTYKPAADKGAKGGARGDNKYQAFIEDLKEKKAKVDVELKGLLDTTHKADSVMAALAEFDQKVKNGDLNVRGKGAKERAPNEGEVSAARKMAEELEMTSVVAGDAKKIADFVNKLEPDFLHAKLVMADPFGTPEQKRTNRFDEFLSTLSMTPGALEEQAKKFNISVERYVALVKEARNKVELIDLSAATKNVADETRKLVESNSIASANLITDEREKARALYDINEKSIRDANDQRIRLEKARGVDTTALEAAMRSGTESRAAALARQLESPIEKLSREWTLTTNKMKDASASWANGTVDMFVDAASTGKLEFGSLVKSIASDMLKLQLKDMFADPMKGFVSGGMKMLGSVIGPGAGPGADAAAAAASTLRMGDAAKAAKDSLGAMTTEGVNASTQALIAGVAAQGQEAIASGTFSGSIGIATTAVYAFASALQASSGGAGGSGVLGTLLSLGAGMLAPGSLSASVGNMPAVDYSLPTAGVRFADGGIMTDMGSVPLRKYAAGGIARSPQLAMYGEAGPEAYVPLPDGRSIPVTMSGGQGGTSVTIQINVTPGGGEDKSSASDEVGGWRKLAERVRSVVREELVVGQRPGGVLYK